MDKLILIGKDSELCQQVQDKLFNLGYSWVKKGITKYRFEESIHVSKKGLFASNSYFDMTTAVPKISALEFLHENTIFEEL